MKIAVLKERAAGEARVAATPETVKKFIGLGTEVAVESGAGEHAAISDSAFAEAGASMGDLAATTRDADIVIGIQAPEVALLDGAKRGACVAALDELLQRVE